MGGPKSSGRKKSGRQQGAPPDSIIAAAMQELWRLPRWFRTGLIILLVCGSGAFAGWVSLPDNAKSSALSVISRLSARLLGQPTGQVRVKLTERISSVAFEPCHECRETYQGHTAGDHITKVTEHVIPLGPDFVLDSVELTPPRRRDVAGSDTYIFYCSRPTERLNGQGAREIVSRCLEAAINRSCAAIADRLYNARNDSIIDYPYKCFAIPAVRRQVTYAVRLKRRTVRVADTPLALDGQRIDADSTYSLGFGEYLSIPLQAPENEVSALVIAGAPGGTSTRQVTFADAAVELPSLARVEMSRVGSRSTSKARLVISPVAGRN